MITTKVKDFQQNNSKSDVMGVLRTLYPNTEIFLTTKKVKNK